MKKVLKNQLIPIGAKQVCQICKNKKPMREFIKPSYANYPIEGCKVYKYESNRGWDICKSCEKDIQDSVNQEIEDMFDNYKEEFINHMLSMGINKELCQIELDAHIENIGINDIDFNDGEMDAKECLSYWVEQ